ncbi:MAG: OsmC family protein [Anaerolineaceae bacterium]|nr:OsmC family protein [Anaerolineaceae bacterium]
MEASVTWKEELSFSGISDSGFTVPLGASKKVGGKNDGFKPMELLLIGLAGCTAMDVISILKKKRQQISSFEVKVFADRADTHPKVFTKVKILYKISGKNVSESAVERAMELSEGTYCPAQAMLGKAFPIELAYEIREE